MNLMKSKEPVVLVEASFSGDPALTAACRKIVRDVVTASKTVPERVRWLDPGCRVTHIVSSRTEEQVETRCGMTFYPNHVGPAEGHPDCGYCAGTIIMDDFRRRRDKL